MQDFIVLGQIPGTQVYFTVTQWLLFWFGIGAGYLVIKFWSRLRLQYLIWRVRHLMTDIELTPFALSR